MTKLYDYRRYVKILFWIILLTGLIFVLTTHHTELKKIKIRKDLLLSQIQKEVILSNHKNQINMNYLHLKSKVLTYFQTNNEAQRNAEILTAIFRSGEINKLIVTLLKPIRWENKNQLIQGSVQLALTGQHHAIWAWFFWVMKMDIPFIIKKFTIKRDNENLLHSDVELSTFFIPAPASQKRVITSEQTALDFNALNLFNSPSPNSTENDLAKIIESSHNTSITQLQWVGYLRQAKEIWALAQLPDKRTFPVTKGTQLGLEKADVLDISPENITLKMNNKKTKINYGSNL